MKIDNAENNSDTVKIATPARYLPSTTSKSLAGIVSSSSSVPWRRSSAQMLIVIAGMNTSMMNGSQRLSWSRFARLLREELRRPERGQRAEHHEHADEHVSRGAGEVADEVAFENRRENGLENTRTAGGLGFQQRPRAARRANLQQRKQ